jgi:hypothetical protein
VTGRPARCSDPTWDLNLAVGDLLDLAHRAKNRCRSGSAPAGPMAKALAGGLSRVIEYCHEHAAELRNELLVGRLRDAELLAMFTARTIQQIGAGGDAAAALELARAARTAKKLARELAAAQRDAMPRTKLEFALGDIFIRPEEEAEKVAAAPDDDRRQEPLLVPEQLARRPVEPSASAGRLLAAATRVLPAADQDRYSREFESELWDLAAQGASRSEQLRYGLRQAAHVAQLRDSALSPRRRSAAP